MDAFDVLNNIKSDIDNSNPRPTITDVISDAYLKKWKILENYPPFDFFGTKKYLHSPSSHRLITSDHSIALHWAIRQIISGMGVRETIELAKKQITDNSITLMEISEFKGVKISQKVELEEGYWLYPYSELPEHYFNNHVFIKDFGLGRKFFTGSAALITIFKLDLVYTENSSEYFKTESYINMNISSNERRKFRNLLRRSMIIQKSSYFDVCNTYHIPLSDSILWDGLLAQENPSNYNYHENIEPDIERIREILKAFRDFDKPDALTLSIDRVSKSRLQHDHVSNAIELGMALEIALMHGEKTENQEIGHKLGMRAGWLLGDDPTSRIEIKKRVQRLYSARSKAVHNGKVDVKDFDPVDADCLVQQILLSILKRGKFPNWEQLTFGGAG